MDNTKRDPQMSDFDQQVRELRNSIDFHFSGQQPFSILITSPGQNEGKSKMSSALAKSFLSLQKNVLLINGNFSESQIKQSSESASRGLADLVLSDDDLNLVTSLIQHLDSGIAYLPLGKTTSDSAVVLGNDRFAQLMSNLKADFDVIIVDGPAAFGKSDVQFIGRVTDTTLFVIPRRRASQRQLMDAVEALRSVGADVLGGVLTV